MTLKQSLLTALIALAAGFAGAGLWSMAGLDDTQTRKYLLENPQILPEMVAAYERGESQAKLAEVADGVGEPFPGAVLGDPEGSVTLVEFSDYNCTYCRASLPHVKQLIADNPDLRVVLREWPIFDGSEDAARMALAAAKQGKFAAFHDAMFEIGSSSAAGIEAAATRAGLDLERAQNDAGSDDITAELARNQQLARSIGFTGTPSWIAGDQVIEGAVGPARLAEALDSGESS
ncbi:MAG: DsbA family protein [Alteripontixanthobacter sp.]